MLKPSQSRRFANDLRLFESLLSECSRPRPQQCSTSNRSRFLQHSSQCHVAAPEDGRTPSEYACEPREASGLRRVHRRFSPSQTHDASAFRQTHAPNLSNIFAFACIKRMRNFAGKIPSEPLFAPVSVKRSSLSEPLTEEFSNTGCGCHE